MGGWVITDEGTSPNNKATERKTISSPSRKHARTFAWKPSGKVAFGFVLLPELYPSATTPTKQHLSVLFSPPLLIKDMDYRMKQIRLQIGGGAGGTDARTRRENLLVVQSVLNAKGHRTKMDPIIHLPTVCESVPTRSFPHARHTCKHVVPLFRYHQPTVSEGSSTTMMRRRPRVASPYDPNRKRVRASAT